jgi:uncharacterized protein
LTRSRFHVPLAGVSTVEVIELVLIGLVAGALGGMLGIGGSIIMIPFLALVLGPNQHLYQAAAMIVNVFVAVPATIHHWRAGAVRLDVAMKMLPFALALIIVGVLVSDQFSGEALQQIFGVFLIYVILFNIARLVRPVPEPELDAQRTGWPTTGAVGSIMGFLAGLLGIGGGGIAVPLLQRICNLPLRQSIATSSAVMCVTSVIGAIAKNVSLSQHVNMQEPHEPLTAVESMMIAIVLIPTAMIGGAIGARLTHVLPLWWVRLAFTILMTWACLRMLDVV